jgi:group I intron endonuclease
MTEIAHLYRLTSPSGRTYIGIAKNVHKRWQEHSYDARCGSNCALHRAIRKYSFDKFKKEILVTSTFSYVKEMEVKAIAAYSTMAPAGYNMTEGGDGTVGYIFTDEDRIKIGLAQKGRKHSEESKRARSKKLKGLPLSDETKQKLKDAWVRRKLEKPMTDETKHKLSLASRGKTHSVETKAKLSAIRKANPTLRKVLKNAA